MKNKKILKWKMMLLSTCMALNYNSRAFFNEWQSILQIYQMPQQNFQNQPISKMKKRWENYFTTHRNLIEIRRRMQENYVE